jgi:hypothetical protein
VGRCSRRQFSTGYRCRGNTKHGTKQAEKEGTILDLESIVADLKRERDRLSRAIAELEGASSPRARKANVAAPRPLAVTGNQGRGLTPEGRKRLSIAMKKRWAERKKKSS